jgi:hypothetical protein
VLGCLVVVLVLQQGASGWAAGGLALQQHLLATCAGLADLLSPPPPCLARFWGTPIPIWVSEDGEEMVVVGSIQELEELTGEKVGACSWLA